MATTTIVFGEAASAVIGVTDVSTQTLGVAFSMDKDTLEKTAFQSSTHVFTAGLANWSVGMDLFANATIKNLVYKSVGSACNVSATDGTAYWLSGVGIMSDANILEGRVGEQGVIRVNFKAASTLGSASV